MKPKGSSTMCVVPSRYGVSSAQCSEPAEVSARRSLAAGGRLNRRHGRSSLSRWAGLMSIAACKQNPPARAAPLASSSGPGSPGGTVFSVNNLCLALDPIAVRYVIE
jgi:hypothetical protein